MQSHTPFFKKTHPMIGQHSATATSTQIVRRNELRRALLIFNNEEENIAELHSSQNGQYGTGIPILPKVPYENYHFCQGAYYVICDTGKTADLRYEEDIEG